VGRVGPLFARRARHLRRGDLRVHPAAHERAWLDPGRRSRALGAVTCAGGGGGAAVDHEQREQLGRWGSSSGSPGGSSSGAARRATRAPGSTWGATPTRATASSASRAAGRRPTRAGYTCQTVSWGTGCEPGGTCARVEAAADRAAELQWRFVRRVFQRLVERRFVERLELRRLHRHRARGLVFSPYKDTSINMNEHERHLDERVRRGDSVRVLPRRSGRKTVTLAFATGECGSENWRASPARRWRARTSRSSPARGELHHLHGRRCRQLHLGTDAGFATFINSWASPNLIASTSTSRPGNRPA